MSAFHQRLSGTTQSRGREQRLPASKYCMDNLHDDERSLSIFKLMSPGNPARAADPATRSFRWALAEQRLAQMAAEAEERVRVLKRLGSPEF